MRVDEESEHVRFNTHKIERERTERQPVDWAINGLCIRGTSQRRRRRGGRRVQMQVKYKNQPEYDYTIRIRGPQIHAHPFKHGQADRIEHITAHHHQH